MVQDKITFRIVNTVKNAAVLSDMPHRNILDLSVIYYVVMGQDENGIASIKINNQMLSRWGVTEDMLWDIAKANTERMFPVKVASLFQMMMGLMDDEEMFYDMPQPENEDILVLTNASGINGASCLLYKGVLQALADRFDSDIFILPSSIHECLIANASVGMSPAELKEMVMEVNATCVAQDEILSDSVYCFHRETGNLLLVY